MKHYLSALLALTLLAGLTACGGGTPAANTTPTATRSAAAASAQKEAKKIPDLAGKTYQEATSMLTGLGLQARAVDTDRKSWANPDPDGSLIIRSTYPAAGAMTVGSVELMVEGDHAEAIRKAKAAADAAVMATRYEFKCGASSWSSSSSTPDTYHSLKEVWASKHYAGSDTCTIKIGGYGINDHPYLIQSEKDIAAIATNAGGGGGGSLESDFGIILQLCTKLDADYADRVVARMDWKKNAAKAALALCPDAPHAAVLQDVVTAVKIYDGTHTVGKDMEPGTYRTKPSVKDCYWSRTTGSGQIIANDFVGFAPDGITVTAYAGEGFESKYCGVWTKIG